MPVQLTCHCGDGSSVHSSTWWGSRPLVSCSFGTSAKVLVKSADGYRIAADGVAFDLKNRSLAGDSGVEGTLNIGQFSANQLYADLDTRIVRLSGNARLRINQGVIK